jgi:hypothetical protein
MADPAARQHLLTLLGVFQDPRVLPWAAAQTRWENQHIDEFEPLLTTAAVDQLDSEQLSHLAGCLIGVEGREAMMFELIDRAILQKPDAVLIQYMRGGLSILRAVHLGLDARARPLIEQAVVHFTTAMALRPHSGLVRTSLAGAQALYARMSGDPQGYATAFATLESATVVEPDNPFVWFFRADYLGHDPNGKAAAIDACKQALRLDRKFAPAQLLLEQLDK